MAQWRVKRCPRCSHPRDNNRGYMFLADTLCGFCRWPFSDKGKSCSRCNYINRSSMIDCEACGSRL